MKISVIALSLNDLQQAVRDFVEKAGHSQMEQVYVLSAWDKILLDIPLTPGAVIEGKDFRQATEAS